MRRDMDLVRKILLAIEAEPSGGAPDKLIVEGYTERQISYHVCLMVDAQLLEGFEWPAKDGGSKGFAERMTWQGHDFLDACRDEGRWNKAKSIMTKIGGATLDIMKQILAQVMAEQVKQITGIQP